MTEWLAPGEEIKAQYDDLYITNTRVIKAVESFFSFDYTSIRLEHVSSVTARKRTRLSLVVIGATMFVLFTIFLLPTLFVAYVSAFNGYLSTTFLVLAVLGIVLIALGFVLGPKTVTFESDGGKNLVHRLSSPSEAIEILAMFGALGNHAQ
jgi:hypothetical protein